ncbi:sugar (and other) transporter family protein, partial [Vibrio parahaemolyticus V-223/04]
CSAAQPFVTASAPSSEIRKCCFARLFCISVLHCGCFSAR